MDWNQTLYHQKNCQCDDLICTPWSWNYIHWCITMYHDVSSSAAKSISRWCPGSGMGNGFSRAKNALVLFEVTSCVWACYGIFLLFRMAGYHMRTLSRCRPWGAFQTMGFACWSSALKYCLVSSWSLRGILSRMRLSFGFAGQTSHFQNSSPCKNRCCVDPKVSIWSAWSFQYQRVEERKVSTLANTMYKMYWNLLPLICIVQDSRLKKISKPSNCKACYMLGYHRTDQSLPGNSANIRYFLGMSDKTYNFFGTIIIFFLWISCKSHDMLSGLGSVD